MPDEDRVQPDPPAPKRDDARRARREDDRPARSRRRRDDEDEEDDDEDYDVRRDDGGISTLIPYRNPKALIAYYLGVFSLIPCLGLALGPAALLLGILGLDYKKKNPTAGGTGHAIAGIVLGLLTSIGNWGSLLMLAGVGLFA